MTADAELEAQIRARDRDPYERDWQCAQIDRRTLLRLLDEARAELLDTSKKLHQSRDQLHEAHDDRMAKIGRLATAEAEVQRLREALNHVANGLRGVASGGLSAAAVRGMAQFALDLALPRKTPSAISPMVRLPGVLPDER